MAQFVTLKSGRILARVRRQGHPEQAESFDTLALAKAWAARVEGLIQSGRAGVLPAGRHAITVGYLLERYEREIGKVRPFGRNKADVLQRLEHWLGQVDLRHLTAERVVRYITDERRIRGTTAAIDLTYLGGVLKVARALWRLPVHPAIAAVEDAREMLRYAGQLHRSNERDRRPTADELARLRGWFATRSTSLTADLFDFILDSAFRPPSEIERLLWQDLNERDRTIVIRDRKDPRRKAGNNQVVPLLGRCFDIIMKQPRAGERIFSFNGGTWSTIFPRACRELGIRDLRLYDLRHEAISRLVESGLYTDPEVMLVSGHKDHRTYMRYVQIRAASLHRDDLGLTLGPAAGRQGAEGSGNAPGRQDAPPRAASGPPGGAGRDPRGRGTPRVPGAARGRFAS